MANNRYYLYCPICKEQKFMGKSLGDGIYNNASATDGWLTPQEALKSIVENAEDDRAMAKGGWPLKDNPERYQSDFLEEIYKWMWKHLTKCRKDEFFKGELFKVLTEYDKRIKL